LFVLLLAVENLTDLPKVKRRGADDAAEAGDGGGSGASSDAMVSPRL
jgi:hypothetical protein